MSEVKLLPCPFCGGEVEVKSCSSNFFDSVFEIVCRECGCRQAPSIHKEAVINAWNRRKPMEDIVAELEYQKEKCEEDMEYWNEKSWKDSAAYTNWDLCNRKSNDLEEIIDIVRKGGVEDGETHD